MKAIVLASISPRRKQLMDLLQIKYQVAESGYEEIIQPHLSHKQLVRFLALGKARAAAKKYPTAIIIAADTMVYFQGKVIGKPKDRAQARAMLKSFSGKAQTLVTGVVVMDAASGKVITRAIVTKIHFKKLSTASIESYLKIGYPYDKAGGYNLQGPGLNLIEKIQGDFTNNLGLPMGVVFNALQKFGLKL